MRASRSSKYTRVSRSSFIVMAPCSSAVFNEFWLLIHFINLFSVFLFSYLSPVFLRLCLCLSCLLVSLYSLCPLSFLFWLIHFPPCLLCLEFLPLWLFSSPQFSLIWIPCLVYAYWTLHIFSSRWKRLVLLLITLPAWAYWTWVISPLTNKSINPKLLCK